MMAFSAEEISQLMQTELKIGLDVPPNRHFKKLWATLPDDAQQRVHAAFLHYRELRDPWIKWESVKEENKDVYLLIDMRLWNAAWRSKNFKNCWEAMSELEKRLLRFLLAVDLFKDAGRWREECRHRQRVRNLVVRNTAGSVSDTLK